MLSNLAHGGHSVCVSKSVSKTLNQQVVLTKDESFFKELLKLCSKSFTKQGAHGQLDGVGQRRPIQVAVKTCLLR